MMLTRLYLDRHPLRDGSAAVKIAFTKNRRSVEMSTGISVLPSQWDDARKAVTGRRDRAAVNAHLARKRAETDAAILRLSERPDWPRLSAYEVRDLLLGKEPETTEPKDLFAPYFLSCAELRRATNTFLLYRQTYRRMEAFDPDLRKRTFRDITVDWLTRLDRFMARTAPSQNARNIHFRNIRAVFNSAIDEELTDWYPFRRFKIRGVATAKRSLSVENLRTLFNYPVEPYAQQHLDMFKLMFFLMGINMIDLYNLKEITPDGRVEFNRAKTRRFYSMRVEPEAMEIIERYRGRKNLLNMADTYSDYRNYNAHMNDALQSIGEVKRSGLGGRKTVTPLFPKLSTYWARHSWATIAASLDIPKETIAAGLGHGGNTVTDIYIDFDRRKVDEANRKVIDWVLYGKR